MARPSKGERVQITLRLPVELAERVNRAAPRDRHDWIIEALQQRLDAGEPVDDAGV